MTLTAGETITLGAAIVVLIGLVIIAFETQSQYSKRAEERKIMNAKLSEAEKRADASARELLLIRPDLAYIYPEIAEEMGIKQAESE
jgi:cellobiose-specific phosphotransferase system component IIB